MTSLFSSPTTPADAPIADCTLARSSVVPSSPFARQEVSGCLQGQIIPLTPLLKPLMVERVLGVGRIVRKIFATTEDVADYVAELGPAQREDIAGGLTHSQDPSVMFIPVGDETWALIDAEDYPLVCGYRWGINASGYVIATQTTQVVKSAVWMHRLVLMVGPSKIVDHRDHNKLDNRKKNLRPCSAAQNTWNQKLSSRNTSGIKGVSFVNRKWRGTVEAVGVLHFKDFAIKEDAGAWVRAKREEVHGEFACHGDEDDTFNGEWVLDLARLDVPAAAVRRRMGGS
jgi:hypothetical protein